MLTRIACIAIMFLVTGCGGSEQPGKLGPERPQTPPPALALDGAPVRIQLNSVSLCVGRRYIEPLTLQGVLAGNQSLLAMGLPDLPVTQSSIDVQLFGAELQAADDDLYSRLVQYGVDKRSYPEDWLRVSFITLSAATARTRALAKRLESYEAASTIDREFRSHRRRQDCAGKRSGAGCCIAIEEPAECVDSTLKYGHPADPDVVLHCTTKRCYVESPLTQGDVRYQYDFPVGMLDRWPAVHAGIRSRIEQWRSDQSCAAG